MFVHLAIAKCMNRAGQGVTDLIGVRKLSGGREVAGRTQCGWPDAIMNDSGPNTPSPPCHSEGPFFGPEESPCCRRKRVSGGARSSFTGVLSEEEHFLPRERRTYYTYILVS